MNSQTAQGVMGLLGASDREVGFVEYLPESVQVDITTAISNRLEAEQAELDAAITKGVSALPIFLRIFAGAILK